MLVNSAPISGNLLLVLCPVDFDDWSVALWIFDLDDVCCSVV